MSRAKKDMNAKQFALKKRKRRQWLTFVRMCRYGVNNFSRNAWLTIAATAMMTLTLFVIMVTGMARNVLLDSVAAIRDKVDMSIYIKYDTPQKDTTKMKQGLEKLSSVTRVQYLTPSQAREQFAEANKHDTRALNALNVSGAKFPGVFRVNVQDINNTKELSDFVKSDPLFKKYIDADRPPSFAGGKRDAIANIGRWVSFAEKMGLVVSVILVFISSLIVFNTIRMAIFNRREEIQMMKIIGADKSFIRGPFLVEAIVYGFIAAIIATGLGVLGIIMVQTKLESYGIVVQPTVDLVTTFIGFVLLGMVAAGALIGVISSLFATRKYLSM